MFWMTSLTPLDCKRSDVMKIDEEGSPTLNKKTRIFLWKFHKLVPRFYLYLASNMPSSTDLYSLNRPIPMASYQFSWSFQVLSHWSLCTVKIDGNTHLQRITPDRRASMISFGGSHVMPATCSSQVINCFSCVLFRLAWAWKKILRNEK